jgi:hypothetical protein
MCLKTVDFALQYDRRNKFYYGIGYKKVDDKIAKDLRNWKEATGWETHSLHLAKECSGDGKEYRPGFHIFLDEQSARDYQSRSSVIIRVKFREVLAYGTNETNYDENLRWNSAPCVIARYMKLDEILE